MRIRNVTWGSLYAARAFAFIHFAGERLDPDTGLYARGRASWSSPALALSGKFAGYSGVVVAGVLGSFALGYLVAGRTRGVLRPALLGFSPPGWYTIQPSADSLGASAVVVASDCPPRVITMALVSAFHLEAALVILGAWVVGRFFPVRLDIAATAMGAIACLGQWHFQMRYFLPGIALVAIGRGAFGESQVERHPYSWILRRSLPARGLDRVPNWMMNRAR